MKRWWFIAVTVAFALIAAGFAGWGSANGPAAQAPINIGALTSLTGAFTPWGIEVRDGMQFAVNQINAKGGVNKHKLNLIVADDQSTPNAGIDAFNQLTEQDHVVAVGGLISSDVALATARLAESAHVPMFLVKAGASEILTRSSRYTFRTCLPAAAEVALPILQYAQSRHVKRVGAIVADYAWGQAIKSSLESAFAKAPNISLNVQVAPVTTSDFTTYLRPLIDSRVQLLVATGHPPGSGKILAQAGQLGLKVRVTGAYTPFNVVAKAAGAAAISRWSDFKCENVNSKGYRSLARQFLKAFPNDQFFEDDALAGYAIVKILAQAIGAVGANPQKIASYVRKHTFTIPGYTSTLQWTAWGELAHPRIAFDLLTGGPSPAGLNTGGTWYPKQLSISKPLTPYRPWDVRSCSRSMS